MNEEEKRKQERKQNLLKAFAVSWTMRAMQKGSEKGFTESMEEVQKIVPERIWNKLSKATFNFYEPLESFLKEMEKEIPEDLWEYIGGDIPSLIELDQMIQRANDGKNY
jgi:flagellar biosynthesis/type III secretory pathway protein FliH